MSVSGCMSSKWLQMRNISRKMGKVLMLVHIDMVSFAGFDLCWIELLHVSCLRFRLAGGTLRSLTIVFR